MINEKNQTDLSDIFGTDEDLFGELTNLEDLVGFEEEEEDDALEDLGDLSDLADNTFIDKERIIVESMNDEGEFVLDEKFAEEDSLAILSTSIGITTTKGTITEDSRRELAEIMTANKVAEMESDLGEDEEVLPFLTTEEKEKYVKFLAKSETYAQEKIISDSLKSISIEQTENDKLRSVLLGKCYEFQARIASFSELASEYSKLLSEEIEYAKNPSPSSSGSVGFNRLDRLKENEARLNEVRNKFEDERSILISEYNSIVTYNRKNLERSAKIEEETNTLKESRNNINSFTNQHKFKELVNTACKVVGVEFPITLENNIYSHSQVAVQCSCNHVNYVEISKLPYYISGDIFDNFKYRSSSTSEKLNLYNNNRKGTKQLANTLAKEEEAKEARIRIPGVTTHDEPLTCGGCGSLMLFSLDAIANLETTGFHCDLLSNEYRVKLNSTKTKKNTGNVFDVAEPIKVYMSNNLFADKYKKNLKLEDYLSPEISEDIFVSDERREGQRVVDIELIKLYMNKANFTENELQLLEKDIIDLTKSLRRVINEYKVRYSKEPALRGDKDKTLSKEEYKKKMDKHNDKVAKNLSVKRFLRTYEGSLLKFAVQNGMNTTLFRHELDKGLENLEKFKQKLEAQLVEDIIEALYNNRPIFTFDLNKVRAVPIDRDLPIHSYLQCYEPAVRKMITTMLSLRDAKTLEYIGDIIKRILTLGEIKNKKEQYRESEIIISKLHGVVDTYVQEVNSSMLAEWIADRELNPVLYDEKLQYDCWLVYHCNLNPKLKIPNMLPKDIELYKELYEEVSLEKGITKPFQRGN